MKPTTTWILVADGAHARLFANRGPGKGVEQLEAINGDHRPDSELVRVAEKLTGHAAQAVAFGTEAPYLQQLGCETIVLGPGDIACAHQPGEFLELARLEPTVRLLRQLIQHYCL